MDGVLSKHELCGFRPVQNLCGTMNNSSLLGMGYGTLNAIRGTTYSSIQGGRPLSAICCKTFNFYLLSDINLRTARHLCTSRIALQKQRNRPRGKTKEVSNNRERIRLKMFRRRAQKAYSIFEGVPARSPRFVADLTVNINIVYDVVKQGLVQYLSGIQSLDFGKIRMIAPELGIRSVVKRTDFIRILAAHIVRETLLLTTYYAENISSYEDHLLSGMSVSRRYPLPFLKFLAIVGFRGSYMNIPDTQNYCVVNKGDVKVNIARDVKPISERREFFERLEQFTYVCDAVDPAIVIQHNIWESYPVFTGLYSCTATREGDDIVITHSDNLPTEFEASCTLLFGITYSVSSIPKQFIGDEVYLTPKEYEPHIAFKFWEYILGLGAIQTQGMAENGSFDDGGTHRKILEITERLATLEKREKDSGASAGQNHSTSSTVNGSLGTSDDRDSAGSNHSRPKGGEDP